MPNTPWYNGVVKMKNIFLVEITRCMLQAKGMATRFWGEVIYYSNDLQSLIPTKASWDMVPIKKWIGIKLSIEHPRNNEFYKIVSYYDNK